ncbi:hypothetical protein D5039_08820 [Verminephrobacter aporrectodeae subsp. tuberculatae]|uniref:Uncharacterized protein n=1 Tax=Verminephrobacter aporrectodeae subsp. tuberculatae TaxID=1110392 RepID=A0ABT3KSF9_9BURK|nr:hypothetical protein [Verminephrobacter aporrectodeae subsp. tuberculatae]
MRGVFDDHDLAGVTARAEREGDGLGTAPVTVMAAPLGLLTVKPALRERGPVEVIGFGIGERVGTVRGADNRGVA